MTLPDYRPKDTPDTILDYRKELEGRVRALPPATPDSLGALFSTLRGLRAAAARHPGRWQRGSVQFGADPKEYVPSDEELLVSEVGDRIRRVIEGTPADELANHLKREGVAVRFVEYNAIVIFHVDVMGTGRFFYARKPKPIRLRLR